MGVTFGYVLNNSWLSPIKNERIFNISYYIKVSKVAFEVDTGREKIIRISLHLMLLTN